MLIPTTRKVYEFIKSDIDQANKMFRNQDLVLLNNEIKRKKFKTKLTTFDEMIKQISSNTSLKLSATMMIKDV